MRYVLISLLSLGALCAYGGDNAFPWEELKELYRSQITQELRTVQTEAEVPSVTSIDEAHYVLHIGTAHIEGDVALSGRLVSGKAIPLPLFGAGLVLRETREVDGASLLPAGEEGGTQLLPAEGVDTFRLVATFLARSTQDRGTHTVTMAIPRAVKNRIHIQMEDGLRLLEAPGIPGPSGDYYFTTTDSLTIRFTATTERQAQVPEVDLFTRILLRQGRVVLQTHGVPTRPLPDSIVLRPPEGAQLIDTTLRPAPISSLENGGLIITSPTDARKPFMVETVLSLPEDGEAIRFVLPSIDDNAGREGRFLLVEPDDGQVEVRGTGLVRDIPATQLNEVLHPGDPAYYSRIPPDQPIALTYTPFATEQAVDVVLESQSLHIAFDESGRSLSTLHLDVPAEAGSRLVLEPVAESDIWSLTVNEQPRQVYKDADGAWIVPLDGGMSKIILAYLREGTAMGLRGRLEVAVPKTGLAARMLHVGIKLPDRVALLSIEGPVNSATADTTKPPASFPNATYNFTQPFYRGEGMNIAIAYKEPVDRNHER